MLAEFRLVKRFLGAKFGYGEPIPDGVYAVPCDTSKGDAYMKMEMKGGNPTGNNNFRLFWDEQLTISWDTEDCPRSRRHSSFASRFRKLEKATD